MFAHWECRSSSTYHENGEETESMPLYYQKVGKNYENIKEAKESSWNLIPYQERDRITKI